MEFGALVAPTIKINSKEQVAPNKNVCRFYELNVS